MKTFIELTEQLTEANVSAFDKAFNGLSDEEQKVFLSVIKAKPHYRLDMVNRDGGLDIDKEKYDEIYNNLIGKNLIGKSGRIDMAVKKHFVKGYRMTGGSVKKVEE